jgi:hypothetical protein
MYALLVGFFRSLNELLTAGIAITAFSLLLYALSFNLRDRVARSFAIILICVVISYVAEALSSVASTNEQLQFWLRFQWVGIVLLPAAYLHLSDALLATTGRPSRGRRRFAVRMSYGVALVFLLALPADLLVGSLIHDAQPAPHLQRTLVTWIFTGFYAFAMLLSWGNFYRAYQRTVTSTSRRRMGYLITGALAPALGSFPYLLFGSTFAANHQLIFWLAVTLSNVLVSGLLVLMAYAVAFFGVPWPDRVVKRRLFKWLMRGPVTASTVLAITTLVRRLGVGLGQDFSALLPVMMVASILIMEHLITLIAPAWERWLLFGPVFSTARDRSDLELLQILDERLLTQGDLQQFLEAILAAVCDRLQVSKAFLAALSTQPGNGQGTLEMLVSIGDARSIEHGGLGNNIQAELLQEAAEQNSGTSFNWGEYRLIPLRDNETNEELMGLLGVERQPGQVLDSEQQEALEILTERAALAMRDRRLQRMAFNSLEELTPEMDMIQRLRAASRYDGAEILSVSKSGDSDAAKPAWREQGDLSPWVKDALTHYWGGPKLTQNPLLELEVVQQAARQQEETPTNALRAVLRNAIEQVRPEGERRFTGEWILYNILEMKFMEGRKVREIAMRLAVSEADLYRKQRIAIEAVANAILEMEKQARQESQTEKEIEEKPSNTIEDMVNSSTATN